MSDLLNRARNFGVYDPLLTALADRIEELEAESARLRERVAVLECTIDALREDLTSHGLTPPA
jgi:hypothetical protein